MRDNLEEGRLARLFSKDALTPEQIRIELDERLEGYDDSSRRFAQIAELGGGEVITVE